MPTPPSIPGTGNPTVLPSQNTATVPLTSQIANQVNNPSLAPGTAQTSTDIVAQSNEFIQGADMSGPAAQAGNTQASATGTQIQGVQQGQAQVAPGVTATPAAQYNAALAGDAAQMTAAQGDINPNALVQAAQGTVTNDPNAQAAQGTVDPNSLVKNQYEQLMDFQAGETPDWAKGAVREAEAKMNARGLGASTIAGSAVTSALMSSALPIAQADAKVFENMNLANLNNRQQAAMMQAQRLAQMDLANLNNRQQAAVTNAQAFLQMDMANLNNQQQAQTINAQMRQQTMLSDQAAQNAAKQFNATSQNQVDQFFSNLAATIGENNARRNDVMEQFNANLDLQKNAQNANNTQALNLANAQMQTQIEQFNAKIKEERDKFNAQNILAIEQANTAWRRMINTSNTAGENAANQTNVQNMFNMSQWAQAALWQQFRDEASWANTASENDQNRQHNLAVAALQRDATMQLMNQQQRDTLFAALGNFSTNMLNNLFNS
jgi:hypothetical protein